MKYIKDVPMVTTNHRNPIPKTRKSVLFSKKEEWNNVYWGIMMHFNFFNLAFLPSR